MDRPPAPRPGEPSGIEPRPHPFGPPPGRPSSVRRAADALGRVAPFLERLARRTLRWALLSLAGAVLVWWLLADRVVTGGAGAASLAVWAVVLLAPPAILAADGVALRALARLPERLRALPGEAAGRAGELRRLAEEVGRSETVAGPVRCCRCCGCGGRRRAPATCSMWPPRSHSLGLPGDSGGG